MTMHLVKGMSALNLNKRKNKKIKVKVSDYVDQHQAYNKRLRQQHRHAECLTLEQYIEYVHGKSSAATSRKQIATFTPPAAPYRRETPNIPSVDRGGNYTAKPDTKVYTGTLVKGIAQTHKSNAVPVIDEQHIKDIAHMRR